EAQFPPVEEFVAIDVLVIGGAGADEELADGVVPDVAEYVDGLFECAAVGDGARHDRLHMPQGGVAEAAEEPVHRQHLRGPGKFRKGVVERGGGHDDAFSRVVRQFGTRYSFGVVGDQQDHEVFFVPHVVVQGRGPDPELGGQSAEGQFLPAVAVDESARGRHDLGAGGDRRASGPWSGGAGRGHALILPVVVFRLPTVSTHATLGTCPKSWCPALTSIATGGARPRRADCSTPRRGGDPADESPPNLPERTRSDDDIATVG